MAAESLTVDVSVPTKEGVLNVRGVAKMPVVPPLDPNDEKATTNLYTTRGILAEIDLAAELESEMRKEKVSRSEMMNYCIKWGLSQHWKEKGREAPVNAIKELETLQKKKSKK